MRIYKKDTNPELKAVKFAYQNGAPPRYRVFPRYRRIVDGSRKNTLQEEVAFETIEHAAEFLVRHPESAIRMNPGGRIVFRQVVIDVNGHEPEPSADIPDDNDLEEEQ